MAISFKKINFSTAQPEDLNRLLNMLVASLDDIITPLSQSPLSSPILIKNIQLSAGQLNYINHKYPGVPQSWIVCKCNNVFNMVKESATPNPIPDKQVILESTCDAVVDLLFF